MAKFSNAARAAALLLAGAAFLAAGVSAPRAAEPLGLEGETIVELEGTVVDVGCELGGACPANCGEGRRLLGLRLADGTLRAAVKGPVDFAGAAVDLKAFCGRPVKVDGLLIEKPGVTILQIQNIAAPGSPLAPARAFEAEWQAKNGPPEEWFRKDKAVEAIIARDGVLGIKGLEPKK
jgi:hypothetical protein